MKNRIKRNLGLAGGILLLTTALAGCGKTANDNTLRIIVRNAGYGDSWIYELEKSFEAKHEGIDVDITSLYDANTLIQSHLESRNNKDDLYISIGTDWRSFAAQGYFLELDDLLKETVDGVTVADKVADEYKESLFFSKSDGSKHCYRLPWTSGKGGIYYNKALFKNNGWDEYLKAKYPTNQTGLPETFEQLLDLCKKINLDRVPVAGDRKKAVKPFAYTGANTDYFDYAVFDWWSQIAGVDNIKEFLKYESQDNYDTNKNQTYAALKTATNYWTELFCSKDQSGEITGESEYVIEGSKAKSAESAQKEFVNGFAAMMFNGDWLYNEILAYNPSPDKFELGLMKTPAIKEAKEENLNSSYIIGEDQYIVIPKTAPNANLAKEFIKLMISNEGSTTFTKYSNGFLAYNTDFSNSNITDSFVLDAINIRNSYTQKFTSYSANRKYLCNYIDIWCTGALRPFLNLLNGTASVDSSFKTIAGTANANWTDWTNKSR